MGILFYEAKYNLGKVKIKVPAAWVDQQMLEQIENLIAPGGVLRGISDGEVRRPFWGLKFEAWDFLGVINFLVDFFLYKDFGKDFSWG